MSPIARLKTRVTALMARRKTRVNALMADAGDMLLGFPAAARVAGSRLQDRRVERRSRAGERRPVTLSRCNRPRRRTDRASPTRTRNCAPVDLTESNARIRY